jgi:hypothetical protein
MHVIVADIDGVTRRRSLRRKKKEKKERKRERGGKERERVFEERWTPLSQLTTN